MKVKVEWWYGTSGIAWRTRWEGGFGDGGWCAIGKRRMGTF